MSIERKLTVLAIAVYVVVFAWVFTQNLTADTDYPYHLHNVWAVNQGYLALNPFLNGGCTPTLAYGGPPLLLGGAIYPIFGVYTVAVLTLLGLPLLWYFSRKMFHKLTTKRIARLATLAVVLNPLTVQFFLTVKLPFVWGAAFAFASLAFYLEGRNTYAAILGALAVVTHPLSIFLLGAVLLLEFNLKRWVMPYLPACAVIVLQLFFLFGVGGGGGGGIQIFILETILLAAALVTLFIVRAKSRIPCTISLLVLAGAIVAALVGVGIPTVLFDRIAWFVFIVSVPFLIKLALPRLKPAVTYTSILALVLCTVIIGMRPALAALDNPSVYKNLLSDEQTVKELREGYVRYSTDGSALYILPIAGVKFSNAGQERHEISLDDNAQEYYERLLGENASFVLIYRSSPEEDYLVELHSPLIYSKDNLRIYEVPH